MNPTAHTLRNVLILGLLLVCSTASTASAQEGVYVEGAVFADIRQFGSTSAFGIDLGNDFSLDSTGIGGSVRVGTWLDRRWTIEAGLDLSSKTTVGFRNPFILALFPPGQAPLDLEATTKFTSVTTMLGYHQRAGDDVRFGYLVGFSFLRATYGTEFPGISIPLPTFTRDALIRLGLPGIDLTEREIEQTQNHGALALGVEAAIEIADDLDVVPELRAFVFSRGDSTVFLIRPGAAVRWSFD